MVRHPSSPTGEQECQRMSGKTQGPGPDRERDPAFEAMLEQSFKEQPKLSPGDKVDTRVISVGPEHVFLDLGTRYDGLLPRPEVTSEEGEVTVQPGDRITVFIASWRDGTFLCTKRLGQAAVRTQDERDNRESTLEALRTAQDSGMPVDGQVAESVKGGFSVTVMGQRAFCPISQIDNKYTEDPTVHVGQSYAFEIVKIEEGGRNIVVSRRRLLEREAEELAGKIWGTLHVGQQLEGVVTTLKPYGAFVDVGGIEGLLHVSELSFGRVNDPKDVLGVGQKLTVAIKDLDQVKKKISLSLKSLLEDPWTKVAESLSVGQVLRGKITRLAQFGAFVQVQQNVEGLIHISEMAQERRINSPREVVKEGQSVVVRVLEIDRERRRIGLALEADDEPLSGEPTGMPTGSGPQRSFGTLADMLGKALQKPSKR
jgi:small subunit ribosomal protein S1